MQDILPSIESFAWSNKTVEEKALFSDDAELSEQSNENDYLSDAEIEDYEIRYRYTNRQKYNITFLYNANPRIKKRYPLGRSAQRRIPATNIKRCTPDKFSKYKIIKDYHNYLRLHNAPTIKKFLQHYSNHFRGYTSFINKLSYSAWRRYSAKFKPGSQNFAKLEKYIQTHSEKQTSKHKRFYTDPEEPSYGLLPIFEEFLIEYRKIVASESQWRSIKWFVFEGKRILQNERLMSLLKPFMSQQERKLLKIVICSRSYIKNVIVCYNNHYIIITQSLH